MKLVTAIEISTQIIKIPVDSKGSTNPNEFPIAVTFFFQKFSYLSEVKAMVSKSLSILKRSSTSFLALSSSQKTEEYT